MLKAVLQVLLCKQAVSMATTSSVWLKNAKSRFFLLMSWGHDTLTIPIFQRFAPHTFARFKQTLQPNIFLNLHFKLKCLAG